MNTFKRFIVSLAEYVYDSVIVSYKSTLVGLGFSILIEAINFTTNYLNGLPQPWAHAAAGVVAFIGMFLRSQQAKNSRLAKRALMRNALVGLCLVFALSGTARAAEATGPLSVQMTDEWSFHLNIAVPAFAYSITQDKLLGQLTFGLNYALDYKEKFAVGIGGGYLQTDAAPGMMFTGMLGGPVLPYTIGEMTRIRPAILYEYKWSGAEHENIIAATMALQF